MKTNWQTKKLGDICDIYQPKTISAKEMTLNGKYVVFGANGIIGRYDKYNHEEPQLLITCRGATCGSVNISEPKSWITGNAMVVRPKDSSLDFKFLEYLFRGGLNISKVITGAAQPQITRTNLEPIEISYPESLIEQKRIVKILDEVFENVEKAKEGAEKNLQNSKELFESYLNNIFTSKKKDWKSNKLDEVCEMINRGVSPKYIESKGLCVLNQKCVRDHKINFSLSRLHDFRNKKVSNEKYLQIGDVLVNSTGTGTLGRVAQVKELPIEAITDSHITIVRPMKNIFYSDFFGYGLIFVEKEISKRGDGCGGQTELARNTLKNDFSINYPISISVQKDIVKKINIISEQTKKFEVIYKKKLTDLEELKKSVLKKAFSGEL